ncbi:carboxymuconolactone decarboxylase family protein [Nucisporomicrobium flavum]|uniref:carboxymuconolactone decarboxylase family protein n=1 Tax=Nucisporomicrobium flavum TaxID=2785915 RepID=UPI0018F4F363|nr:carboxymuconolactone decarboxylase family protein [Nucisporomicrobium flavum]
MNASDTMAGRIAAGRAVYARNLGVPEDEAQRMLQARAGAQYAREAFLAAGGPGWSGTDLTDRDRSIAVIAALVGHHVVDARLTPYLNAARAAGVTEEGLAELMVLLTAYLGQPAASAAMAAALSTAPRPGAVTTD